MKVLLIGGGELLGYVAREARAQGHDVSLVVEDAAEASALARQLDVVVVAGDGTDPAVLRDTEVALSDLVVAITARDPDNLLICQVARKFFDVPRTVALVNDPDNRVLFEKLGVGQVVSPVEILGAVIRQESGFEGIVSRLALRAGQLGLLEVRLGAGAPAVGRRLQEVPLPDGALVVAILRGGDALIPRGAAVLDQGDELLVICHGAEQEAALAALVGKAE